MKLIRTITACVLMLSVCVFSLSAQTIADGEKALDAVYEQINFGDVDYSCTVTLIVEKPSEPKSQMQFKLFERPEKEQFSLIQILPEADKGNGYLREGDNLWFYDAVGRQFQHTSIKENIGESDTKISDLESEYNWRDDFQVLSSEVGKLGSYDCLIVEVKGISSNATYAKEILYIRKDIPILLKEEDYSSSDRLMRTILMPKYTKVQGKYVATQVIMRDELNPGEQTQQIISDISLNKLPDKIFTKAYLESIN
ncbi:MAG: outer membrane lipoprotein-sorting protein [Spirochaetaceae bacterium]|nr:outer membrane lipoprotein-sorting protein [Spirochaetaceae bacterium]MBO4726859.1 outer membrane lipoprotein-sorting protein [Spirochaetaceae bacterium]